MSELGYVDYGDADAAEDYQVKYLRTLAEFDNYRKRIDKERDEIGAAGKRDLLLGILDIADSFERAAEAAPGRDGPDALAAGFLAIYRQLQKLLADHGVEAYESVGEAFDPERMEALGVVQADGIAPGYVVAEASRGYLWNGKLLRPAKVQVSD